MREKCPKTGRVINKPDECVRCEFLMVTIPAGWMCLFHNGRKRRFLRNVRGVPKQYRTCPTIPI